MVMINEPASRGYQRVIAYADGFPDVELRTRSDEDMISHDDAPTPRKRTIKLEDHVTLDHTSLAEFELMRPSSFNGVEQAVPSNARAQSTIINTTHPRDKTRVS